MSIMDLGALGVALSPGNTDEQQRILWWLLHQDRMFSHSAVPDGNCAVTKPLELPKPCWMADRGLQAPSELWPPTPRAAISEYCFIEELAHLLLRETHARLGAADTNDKDAVSLSISADAILCCLTWRKHQRVHRDKSTSAS